MSLPRPGHPRQPTIAVLTRVRNLLESAEFSAALTHTIVASQVGSLLLHELFGWAGSIAILLALAVLASLTLFVRRESIDRRSLLPISLLIFVGWAAISVSWSQYGGVSAAGAFYLLAVTLVGVYIALIRDTIQIARAFGNVLRAALGLSLGLEIFSGILIDFPLGFLRIQGNIADLGPLQGIFGTRNQLGIVALVAIVTFATELRTQSVTRRLAIGSLILAGGILALARSPIAYATLIVVVLATVALITIRRVSAERKRIWQFGLLATTIGVGAICWAARTPIIDAFSASDGLSLRLSVWRPIRILIPVHSLEGWGWTGQWWEQVAPFRYIRDGNQASGLNVYLDVWFQLGLVGLIAFLFMASLAFTRSWLLASRQRSFVYAWPALVLLVMLVSGLAESSLLIEFGWLTFVVCSVKASRELSWRRAFSDIRVPQRLV